ncbi:hypothetical protein ES708_24359 [subsurface metagenome]
MATVVTYGLGPTMRCIALRRTPPVTVLADGVEISIVGAETARKTWKADSIGIIIIFSHARLAFHFCTCNTQKVSVCCPFFITGNVPACRGQSTRVFYSIKVIQLAILFPIFRVIFEITPRRLFIITSFFPFFSSLSVLYRVTISEC